MLDGMRRTTRSQLGRGVLAWLGLGASACPGPPPPLPELSSDEASAECGNGEVEDGEECDGTNWQGATCASLGYDRGMLDCSDECRFVVLECELEGMVLVPEGEFTMGSNEEDDLAQPIRQVMVDAFFIDKTEVTVAEYAECVSAGACDPPMPMLDPDDEHDMIEYYNYDVDGRGEHPINGVNWARADAYCKWVGDGTKRLPTEAEWEKAARGTDERPFPWGDEPPTCEYVVMNQGCGMGSTSEVGSKSMGASPYGALDMAGNVGEWVNDWYGNYLPEDVDNPTGPASGGLRVVRGGGWYFAFAEDTFRVSRRGYNHPDHDYHTVGFRCAKDPSTSQ